MALSNTVCARAQCTRFIHEGSNKAHCSGMCFTLTRYTAESLNLHTAIGETPLTDELLVKTKRLVNLYDDIQTVKRKLRTAAIESGMQPSEWTALLAGKHRAQRG